MHQILWHYVTLFSAPFIEIFVISVLVGSVMDTVIEAIADGILLEAENASDMAVRVGGMLVGTIQHQVSKKNA